MPLSLRIAGFCVFCPCLACIQQFVVVLSQVFAAMAKALDDRSAGLAALGCTLCCTLGVSVFLLYGQIVRETIP